MHKKKKSGRLPIVMQIIIFVCFVFILYQSLGALLLGIFGTEDSGFYTGYSSNMKKSVQHSQGDAYTISVCYKFYVDDKAYTGGAIFKTDYPKQSLEEGEFRRLDVTYMPFLPYWNMPSEMAQLDELEIQGVIYDIAITAVIVLFSVLIIKADVKSKKVKEDGANDRQK